MADARRAPASRIAGALRPSPIRHMAPYLQRPEVISLAGGVPDPETFPVQEVADAVAEALGSAPASALQYGRTRGSPALLERLAAELDGIGIPAHDRLFVTSGSQQGLDLCARLLLDPGDAVVVETPTYVGALAAFRAAGARPVALDRGGPEPDPEAVDRAVARARAQGADARALYLVPSFQNPAGTTLTRPARAALLAAAARNHLVVIEDDPYRELWFSSPPPAPLASLAGDAPVLYLGSFSKVLAPGLRIGFVVAPPELAVALERLKEATDLCTSTLSQAVALALLESGAVAKRLPALRAAYGRRRDVTVARLADGLPPGASFTRPEGGFFTWVELPGVDVEALLRRALERQVAFVGGAPFHAEGGGEHTLRLAYSKEPEERLAEGLDRLLALVAEAVPAAGRRGAAGAGS